MYNDNKGIYILSENLRFPVGKKYPGINIHYLLREFISMKVFSCHANEALSLHHSVIHPGCRETTSESVSTVRALVKMQYKVHLKLIWKIST